MLNPISREQTFTSSLESFIKDADKFIKLYYSGNSEDSDLESILEKVGHLAADAAIAHLEFEQERRDSIADFYDSAWVPEADILISEKA